MNAERRKAITAAFTKMEELKDALETLKGQAEELVGELETIRDEEQDYFDNMPESFQQGDRGQSAESAIEYLETAIEAATAVQDFDAELDEALEALDNSTNA
jgi:uncharacterized coiled-coil DUF342 family protein